MNKDLVGQGTETNGCRAWETQMRRVLLCWKGWWGRAVKLTGTPVLRAVMEIPASGELKWKSIARGYTAGVAASECKCSLLLSPVCICVFILKRSQTCQSVPEKKGCHRLRPR